MSFASDTFSGSAATVLETYNSAWSKQSGYTTIAYIGNDGQYAHTPEGGTAVIYQHSGSPASADYSVFADVFRKSGTPGAFGPQMGVTGRAAAGSGTFYLAFYDHSATAYKLRRFNSGSSTTLGTDYTHTLTTTPERLELRMSGNDISVYVDSTLRIGPVTDGSPITSAGKAGIYLFDMRQTGIADTGGLDNFDAVDAGGGGGSSAGAAVHYYRQLMG